MSWHKIDSSVFFWMEMTARETERQGLQCFIWSKQTVHLMKNGLIKNCATYLSMYSVFYPWISVIALCQCFYRFYDKACLTSLLGILIRISSSIHRVQKKSKATQILNCFFRLKFISTLSFILFSISLSERHTYTHPPQPPFGTLSWHRWREMAGEKEQSFKIALETLRLYLQILSF